MNARLAALLTALVVSAAAPAYGADAQKSGEKANKPMSAQKSDQPGELFSKAQKALQERAAKTAEVVKKNVANIKKRVSGEPEPPSKNPAQTSAAKDKKDKKGKKDRKDKATKAAP